MILMFLIALNILLIIISIYAAYTKDSLKNDKSLWALISVQIVMTTINIALQIWG